MNIFGRLLGHASEVDLANVNREYARILAEGETVEGAYQVLRDMFLFTNKRLILVDKQGLTGRKIEYHSIPYRSITHFSIETSGHFDLEAELKLWVTGMNDPIVKTFNRNVDIYALQSVLATYILK